MSILRLERLDLEIGARPVCRGLDLAVRTGERWAILGRNGIGKTTLLHCILGLRPHQGGEIFIDDEAAASLSRQQLALRLGILPQQALNMVPATVMETVILGRHPHAQSLLRDSPEDVALALQTLEAMQIEHLAERQLDTLSGGEGQRVALAMLLAQSPRLFLLDEPSNHLDVAFQVRMMTIFERVLRERGASLLMATHDINLAARFCDKVLLLTGDGEHVAGEAQAVLTADNLSLAYGCQIKLIKQDGLALFYPAQESPS